MHTSPYTAYFDQAFLLALSAWIKGWREEQEKRRLIADRLVAICEKLPEKFRTCDSPVYRKRFINAGEVTPIVYYNDLFEGIASWSLDADFTKRFKAYVRADSKFTMLFEHRPGLGEVVVNIASLWKDAEFIKAVEQFKIDNADAAEPFFKIGDAQSEVVLRSTLKGDEIIDIVAISSAFDELCDQAGIPHHKRNEVWKIYEENDEPIPIELPSFIGSGATKKAITNTLKTFREKIDSAAKKNIPVNWSNALTAHPEDLKHKMS